MYDCCIVCFCIQEIASRGKLFNPVYVRVNQLCMTEKKTGSVAIATSSEIVLLLKINWSISFYTLLNLHV